MDTNNIIQPDMKIYDINWDNVKTIKDIKLLLQIMTPQLQIDHNDVEDVKIFEGLNHLLKL